MGEGSGTDSSAVGHRRGAETHGKTKPSAPPTVAFNAALFCILFLAHGAARGSAAPPCCSSASSRTSKTMDAARGVGMMWHAKTGVEVGLVDVNTDDAARIATTLQVP